MLPYPLPIKRTPEAGISFEGHMAVLILFYCLSFSIVCTRLSIMATTSSIVF